MRAIGFEPDEVEPDRRGALALLLGGALLVLSGPIAGSYHNRHRHSRGSRYSNGWKGYRDEGKGKQQRAKSTTKSAQRQQRARYGQSTGNMNKMMKAQKRGELTVW